MPGPDWVWVLVGVLIIVVLVVWILRSAGVIR